MYLWGADSSTILTNRGCLVERLRDARWFLHLFFYVFDVGEQVPTSDIAVFTADLKLQNEFFH
jgi:hypothetical protein